MTPRDARAGRTISASRRIRPPYEYVIDKPALMIAAADDWALPVDFTEGMETLLPQLEKHIVPDAAHWLQQEKPDEVTALVLGWLQRNF